jgi:hypothetical protein
MLKHCAANRKRRLSTLPDIGPHIYTTLKFLALQGAPYMYDISRLRVNNRRFGKLCQFHIHKCLWRWNRHSVPKRRLLNPTRRGTTQKLHATCLICSSAKNLFTLYHSVSLLHTHKHTHTHTHLYGYINCVLTHSHIYKRIAKRALSPPSNPHTYFP